MTIFYPVFKSDTVKIKILRFRHPDYNFKMVKKSANIKPSHFYSWDIPNYIKNSAFTLWQFNIYNFAVRAELPKCFTI